MKTNALLLTLLASSLLLASCGAEKEPSSSEFISSEEPLSSSVISSSSSEEEAVSSSEETPDNFDTNLIGVWYTQSVMMNVLQLNTKIEVFADKTAQIANVHFSYEKPYVGDPDGKACQFRSDSGVTVFVLSYDEKDDTVDWAFADAAGYNDLGYASHEEYTPGLKYDYVGSAWPEEKINEYLGTTGTLPAWNASEYKLYLGHSSLYNDAAYAMVEINNISSMSLSFYVEDLNNAGWSVAHEEYGAFYVGFDETHTYAVRAIMYDQNNDDKDDQLCVFFYNYLTIYKE